MAIDIYPPIKFGQIYKITNTTNGKFYIGQTTRPIYVRWKEHCYYTRRGKLTRFCNAIRKYTTEAFVIEMLEDGIPQTLLNEREIYWIATLRPHYNSTSGGEGIRNLSDESRQKMSFAAKNRPPEQRAIRAAKLRGRKQTPEAIAKTAAANRGRKLTATAIAKRTFAKSLWWRITTPNGDVVIRQNLHQYAKENNLGYGNLLTHGKTKGYIATKLSRCIPKTNFQD